MMDWLAFEERFSKVDRTRLDVLCTGLEAGVALEVLEIQAAGWSHLDRVRCASECSIIVASDSHLLLYGDRKGEAAKVWAALCRGVACAAFEPGGVRVFGLHFEVPPR